MTNSFTESWLPAVMAFGVATLAILSAVLVLEWWRARRRGRHVARQLRQMVGAGSGHEPSPELFREATRGEVQWLEPFVARLPHRRDLQHLLEQADVSWGVGTFALLTAGSSLVLGVTVGAFTGGSLMGVPVALLGAFLPYSYMRRRRRRRFGAFEEHLPEAIDLVGRAVRAGHAFSTGLQMVADEAPEPVGGEFRRVFEEQKFGLALEDTLLALADRISLMDVRIFVTAILIQREVGGNLAEVLDKIAGTIRERFAIQRQVKVYTAQGRMTGFLLGGMPIALGLLIFFLNPEYMLVLFREPAGRMMVGVALLLQTIGFFVIRRIIDIKV